MAKMSADDCRAKEFEAAEYFSPAAPVGLAEAAEALVAKLDSIDFASMGVEAWARGREYSGPTFGEELEALRAALSQQEVEPRVGEGWEQEADRQEKLAIAYRGAQLRAEEKLCRAEADAAGWKKRAEYLERAALQAARPASDEARVEGVEAAFREGFEVRGIGERQYLETSEDIDW